MSRKKSTILNIIVSCTKLAVSSLLAIVVSQRILMCYGSSVNGVVATATQLVLLLQVLEGGFTTATLVALYQPYVRSDYADINAIISTTALAFRRIALIALSAGIIISVIYPCFLRTSLSYGRCVVVFGLIVLTTVLNFAFFQSRQIMFAVAQKEYIPQTVTMVCITASQLLMLLLASLKVDIIWLRAGVALLLAINGILICLLARRYFPFLKLDVPSLSRKIKGTGDVVVSNIAAVLYSAGPMFLVATFMGASMASVYSVYYSLLSIVSHVLFFIVIAPKNAFGQLWHEGAAVREKFTDFFQTFETGIMVLAVGAYVTCAIAILPFMRLYTAKLPDAASYLNATYVLAFCLLNFSLVFHSSSSLLLEVCGRFRVIRKIQIIRLFVMLFLGCGGAYGYGIVGMLFGLLGANCVVVTWEIIYVYRHILQQSCLLFILKFTVLVSAGVVLFGLEWRWLPPMKSWEAVFLISGVTGLFNILMLGLLSLLVIPGRIRTSLFKFWPPGRPGIEPAGKSI